MTPTELKNFIDLTAAIAHHKQALEEATKAKQQLAHTLYERYGRHAVYRIVDGDQQLDLMVARTKAGGYYFAPRVRFPKESRMAKAEQKRLDRAARMKAFPTQASVARPENPPTVEGLPTEAEMAEARERGQHDGDRATLRRAVALAPYDAAVKHRLPIVGDVEQPPASREPRLLEIREPSGVLLGDESKS